MNINTANPKMNTATVMGLGPVGYEYACNATLELPDGKQS